MKKQRLKISYSPTVLLYLLFAMVRGSHLSAISYAITVFIHETTHYVAAIKRGYRCENLEITLCGAVLYGDFEVMNRRDEIFVALSAPLVNLILAVLLTALWWIIPQSYIYTYELVLANAGMAFSNLLPCYPLDGGRAYLAAMRYRLGDFKTLKSIKRNNIVLGSACIVAFIYTLFFAQVNISIGFFGAFVLMNGFTERNSKKIYSRLTFSEMVRKLPERGIETSVIAFDSETSLYSVYKECGFGRLWVIDIYRNGKKTRSVSVFELEEKLFSSPPSTKLSCFLV